MPVGISCCDPRCSCRCPLRYREAGAERYQEAEAAYRQVIRLDQNNADAHNSLGYLLLDMDRKGETEAAYRQAIGLDPANTSARNGLALVLKYPQP
jgi:Flp pilus assembly protein TadD